MEKLLSYRINCEHCEESYIGKALLNLIANEKGKIQAVDSTTKLTIEQGDVELIHDIGEFTLDFYASFVCPGCQKTNYICIPLPKEITKL